MSELGETHLGHEALRQESLAMESRRGIQDNAPSTKAALVAAGAAAVIGAVLASLVNLIPRYTAAWQVPVAITVAATLLIPAALYLIRSIRVFVNHDPNREIIRYTYSRERGILTKGSIRNVSLRVATLHALLDTLTSHINEDQCQKILHEAGCKAGQSWAKDFVKEYSLVGDAADLDQDYPAAFIEWSNYDASAGMGRLSIAVSNEQGLGHVLLHNSFLSASPANRPLNYWFAGYIEGTLNQLWNKTGKLASVELCSPQNEAKTVTMFTVTVNSRDRNGRVRPQ